MIVTSAILGAYGLIASARLGTQLILAHVHYRRQRRGATAAGPGVSPPPRVSVIYPVYNESPAVLREVLDRASRCLALGNIEFLFVDDGSRNREELEPVYAAYADDDIRVIFQENGGKRKAQCRGFAASTGDVIVTVDSDTLIEPDGLRRLVAPLVQDRLVGAVCGNIYIQNAGANLLTRLQSIRYWMAFEVDRAGQTLARSVMCCSGAFSAYRRDAFERVEERFRTQTFRGHECTYGDDRHLTNLVLGEGYHVVYESAAVAWTYAPETLEVYARQQTRWSKSFYRELFWVVDVADRVHLYSLADTLVQPLLFVLFTLTLANFARLLVVTQDWRVGASFVAMVVFGGALRAVYGLCRTGSTRFLLYPLYGVLSLILLVPIRFKAMFTLTDGRWGTRAPRPRGFVADLIGWTAAYLGVVGLMAVALQFVADAPLEADLPHWTARLLPFSHALFVTDWWAAGAFAFGLTGLLLTLVAASRIMCRRKRARGNGRASYYQGRY